MYPINDLNKSKRGYDANYVEIVPQDIADVLQIDICRIVQGSGDVKCVNVAIDQRRNTVEITYNDPDGELQKTIGII